MKRKISDLEIINNPELAILLTGAVRYDSEKKYAQAESSYQSALTLLEELTGPAHASVAYLLSEMAQFYINYDQLDHALPLMERCLALREKNLGILNSQTISTLHGVAMLYDRKGMNDLAELFYWQAFHRHEMGNAEYQPMIEILENLAFFYKRLQRDLEAAEIHRQILLLKEKELGLEHPELVELLIELATFYKGERMYDQAEAMYRRALRIQETTCGPDHPDLEPLLARLVRLLQAQRRDREAASFSEQLITLRRKRILNWRLN